MTSLTTYPPQIAFSQNPMPVVITSGEADYLAAAAAISVNFLQFAAAITDGNTFVLSWGLGNATMTAALAPDDSGLQFPTGAGDDDYVTGLLEWYQGNPFLDRDFDITVDLITGPNPMLIFTGKLPGPEYNITTTNGGASGNTTPGVTNQPVTNFAHHAETWIGTPGAAAVQAYSANIPLDGLGTGDSSLQIQDELHAFLKPDYPLLGASYQRCTRSIGAAYIKFAQYKGADPSIRKITTSPIFHINRGGLGMQQALLRNLVTELQPDAGDRSKDRFMRQGSKNKLVTKQQPEWLTWLNLTNDVHSVQMDVIIYNSDESNHLFNPFHELTINPYEKYQFITGYEQLNIGGRQTIDKIPVYYTIQLKTGDTVLSDIYAYVVDYNARQWPRYLVYFNSYGAYQTIGTVGKLNAETDRAKDDAQLAITKDIAASTGEFVESNIFIQGKGTLNVGYARANARTTALLQDLFASDAIYIYDAGTLIPIGLDTKNFKFPPDGTNVFAGVIEYFIKYKEYNWTERQPLPDDSLAQLIADAGSPVPDSLPPVEPGTGTIIVEFGDTHLSINDDGQQVYTAARLAGLTTGYRIYSSQMGLYFRTSDIDYDPAGSFTILVPGFLLSAGDQLIIWPYLLNPDES